MILPGFPMPIHSAGGLSYADFLAYIDSQAVNSVPGSATAATSGTGLIKIHSLAESGDMYGSSWEGLGFETASAVLNRAVQHGLPDYSTFLDQVNNGAAVLATIYNYGTRTFIGRNRNNYNSLTYTASAFPSSAFSRLLYWDFSLRKVRKMEPEAGTGPTDFDITA